MRDAHLRYLRRSEQRATFDTLNPPPDPILPKDLFAPTLTIDAVRSFMYDECRADCENRAENFDFILSLLPLVA